MNASQILQIRQFWRRKEELLGLPDAEKDQHLYKSWTGSVFHRSAAYADVMQRRARLIVGRKGTGKSALRLAATANVSRTRVSLGANAGRLRSEGIKSFKLHKEVDAAAVDVWYKLFATQILRSIAKDLAGSALTDADEIRLRSWALSQGFVAEDFGERLIRGARALFPEVRNRTADPTGRSTLSNESFERLLRNTHTTLYVDDFDNVARGGELGVEAVQAAIEAADNISSYPGGPSICLLLREDLWLKCQTDWHYADKVTGLVQLRWTIDELREFLRIRLAHAAAKALKTDTLSSAPFNQLWEIFFPQHVVLDNDRTSDGFSYMVRRTMYSPRDLQGFVAEVAKKSNNWPASQEVFLEGEFAFSAKRLGYLVNEFGDMCDGLSICVRSFAGHAMEWKSDELFDHLGKLIRSGQVKLKGDDSPRALAEFLFLSGFLEVRFPSDERTDSYTVLHGGQRYEVRDGLRHPDYWNSLRTDSEIHWAVRSIFFRAMERHRHEINVL